LYPNLGDNGSGYPQVIGVPEEHGTPGADGKKLKKFPRKIWKFPRKVLPLHNKKDLRTL